MAKYVGDLMYPCEKYIDRNTQQEKTRWLKCGGLFESEDGKFSVQITCMPTVLESGNWFRVFEPRAVRQPKPVEAKPETGFDTDEDIPF